MPPVRPQPQDVYNHFARLSADQQLAVVLEFPSRVDADRLRDAVEHLVRMQPVLGCRFSYEGGTPRFTQGDPSAAFSSATACDVRAVALESAARLLDYGGQGVMHVQLLSGPDRDAVCVRIDHVAADGQGAKQVAALLARLYTGYEDALDAAAVLAAPDRSARRLMRRFSLAERLRLLREREAIRPTWGLPGTGEAPGRRVHAIVTIKAGDFSVVRERAKRLGATVNDVLLAAFYRALFAELGPVESRPMAINVSFDMRRYLDAGDPMPPASNMSSIETALLPRLGGEGFTETLQRAVSEMTRLKAGRPGLSSTVLLEYARLLGYRRLERMAVGPMERGRQLGVSFPFLSNFGVLEPDALAFDGLAPASAVVLPPVGHPPFAMLGPSSYAGELSLTMGYAEDETDPALIERLVGGMAADIVAWSA